MNFDQSVRDFLDEVAAPTPTATGGGVCAVTVAAAAGLAAMSARLSRDLDDAQELTAHVEGLRTRAMALATEDGEAYAAVIEAQRRTGPGREEALHSALEAAAQPPLHLAHLAAETAAVAARLAAHGRPSARGDAVSAVALAAACARSAAVLARINLTAAGRSTAPADEADQAASAAQSSADLALESAGR